MDILNISFEGNEQDLSQYDDDERAAQEKLAGYQPKNKDDRTRAVLTNFLRFLPVDGKRMMAKFIASSSNNEILYNLFRHLLTSILWPGKVDQPQSPSISGAIYSDYPYSQNRNITAGYCSLSVR